MNSKSSDNAVPAPVGRKKTSRLLWPASAACAILVLWFASVTESVFLTYPGLAVTWPFWPEGVHSGDGDPLAGLSYLVVFVAANFAFWTLIVRFALWAAIRLRR